MSNSDLLKSRIRNFSQMAERRVVFGFSIGLGTPEEQVTRIPGLVRRSIEAQPKTRFDRAHFKAFLDSGLTFEVVYYVLDGDYNLYMDVQQAINLEILREFRREGIAVSIPVRILRHEPGA